MKKIFLIACSAITLITISAAFGNNLVNHNDLNNMNSNSSSSTTFTSNSSGYQRGQLSLSAANLSQPHLLIIETSASQNNCQWKSC